jgi:hypothetical protein
LGPFSSGGESRERFLKAPGTSVRQLRHRQPNQVLALIGRLEIAEALRSGSMSFLSQGFLEQRGIMFELCVSFTEAF